ncbi:hypothetical protein D5086_028525 [Populus alba]|uniref:Uncharacterized protein n=1 Tax=Populus alba TaxID=43335 RepID=A0ACC4AYY6_POPAL
MKRKGRSCKEIEIRDKERQRVYMWKTFLQVFVYLQTSYYAEQDCLRIGRGNVVIFPATKPHHATACLLFITKLISCPKQHLKQEQGIRIDMLQSNNVLSLSGNQEMNKLTRIGRQEK